MFVNEYKCLKEYINGYLEHLPPAWERWGCGSRMSFLMTQFLNRQIKETFLFSHKGRCPHPSPTMTKKNSMTLHLGPKC